MNHYNTVIVGGGTGGYEAAIRCSQLGMSTALVEKNKMGGTCLNIGCIPTKAFAHSSDVLRNLKISRKLGIDSGELHIDIAKLVRNKDKIVKNLVAGVEYLMKKNNIAVYRGEAVFLNKHELAVNGEKLAFDNLIIATGSSGNMPPVTGMDLDGIMTSTEILSIDHIPESLLIIGGGVIGCEIACIFQEFGSKVTIVGRRDHLLPGIDRDVAETLAYTMTCAGIRVITGAAVKGVEKKNGVFCVKADTAQGEISASASELMVSAGRVGNSQGLKPLDLEMNKTYIRVDEHMRTNIPNIFAVGDITGKFQLAHVAAAQGIAAAENIAGLDSVINYNAIPSCIFTAPEVASVGITEERAKTEQIPVTIGKFPMAANGRAMTMYETDGFTKLVCKKDTGKVIGASVIGAHATEVIGELTYIVTVGGTLDDIKKTVHGHPTIYETIHEAAHVALGESMQI